MNPDECANPECRRFIGCDPPCGIRSEQDPRFCCDCGDLFPSFQPRSADDPYRIDPDELREGLEVSAEQCDCCGGDTYTIRSRPYFGAEIYEAVCDSCQAPWHITLRPGRLIVW